MLTENADPRQGRNWRYVVGAFQMNIPVRAKKELLLAEENILALSQMENRANPEQQPMASGYAAIYRPGVGADQAAGRRSGR